MAAPRKRLARFALAGVVLPVWFLGGSLVLGALRPGYAPLRDAISELGEKGAPNALIWNIGGFGVVAVLYALYAVAVRAEFGSGWLFRLGVLQAVFIAASAAFNCDPGCPPVPATTTMAGHIIAPPMPITIRQARSSQMLGAKPPMAEKMAKIEAPMKKIRRRPNMSASRPPVTMAIPNTSV